MKLVTIQSNITITVTSSLKDGYKDLTPEGAGEKNQGLRDVLKVQPAFRHVQIKKGQFDYPEEVAEWPTVKALQNDGLLSVVAKKNIDTEKEEAEKKAEEKKKKLDAIPQVKTLGDLAE